MEITVANPQRTKVPLTAPAASKAAATFLARSGVKAGTLSIAFVTPTAMRRLNRERLGHDHVTDIITFDLRDHARAPFDGELVICPAEAYRNARLFGEAPRREVLRYVAHGILHLLGHDDATPGERALMRRKEDEMLSWLSLPLKG